MEKTVLLVCLFISSLFASGQEYLEMLSGNPIWSHYRAHYPIDWENSPYDKTMVEIYGFYYYGYEYGDIPNDLKYIEQEPEFTYFFIDGTEEHNGREYKVLKRMDVNDALANGFNPERFHKELLVREEAGKVYADMEQFKMHRYAHKARNDEYDYKEYNETIYPLHWRYNIEGDEVVVYDFTMEKGSDRIGEYGDYVLYVSSWSGLDGIKRKMIQLCHSFQSIIEGIGLTEWDYGSPMLAYEEIIVVDCDDAYSQVYKSTFNMFYQNDQFIYKATSPRHSEAINIEKQQLDEKYTSYIEPPFFAELKAYLAGEWSPTSIDSATSASTTPSVITDLSGRRLNAIPNKGMYIKDRQKYIVR